MKLELVLTDNFSIQSNSFQEKKMLLITLQEDITQLEKKLLIFVLIESENLLINAQDFKVSWFSMLLEEELVLDLDHFFLRDSR